LAKVTESIKKLVLVWIFMLIAGNAFAQLPQGTYQVKTGDTMARIALDHGISPRDLVSWNAIDPNQLVVGQVISLTPPKGYVAQNQNTNLSSPITNSPPPQFIWPISGKLLSGYSDATRGIEIQGGRDESVLASANGQVVYSGNSLNGYGNLIIIKHDNTYLTAYANNSKLLVKEGDRVSKGQKISEIGNGDAGTENLHFEVRVNGKPVNPVPYLDGTIRAQSAVASKAPASMEDYKSKCKELGFKQGTEDFGKCVLQLSK
jgi:lipoprotein NlpD